MKKLNFTMFVVKLRTPSRANYEHFHVYLAYRRQTGTVVTRHPQHTFQGVYRELQEDNYYTVIDV